MTADRRVAIVIPTYNREDMVAEAVESALAQTVPCRVVVVDDGSTDRTLERLRKFGDAITVLAEENRERGAARNAGARRAGAVELLCFLDADDLLRPGHAEELLALADAHPDAALVTSGALVVDGSLHARGRLPHTRPGPVELGRFLLARETVAPTCTGVRRRFFEAVGGFDPRRALAGSEDWLLTARLLAEAPGIRGGNATALIRKHGANTMENAEGMEESMLLARRIFFQELWDEVRLRPEARKLPESIERRSEARTRVNAATQYYAVGRMGRARAHLHRAAALDPTVVGEPKWGWTWLRTFLGPRLSRRLRRWKERLRRGRALDVPKPRGTPPPERPPRPPR